MPAPTPRSSPCIPLTSSGRSKLSRRRSSPPSPSPSSWARSTGYGAESPDAPPGKLLAPTGDFGLDSSEAGTMELVQGGRGAAPAKWIRRSEMDPRAVIAMSPSEAQASAGGQARFGFAVIERQAVAYSVESAIGSWCRLLLPAGGVGRGELVVDVPDDAGPGRYALRLVANASGEEVAAANVMLRVAGEARPGGEPCLRVLPRPKFDLQPDGTGLPRGPVTSDLWCREVPLEGCAPCLGPIPGSSART